MAEQEVVKVSAKSNVNKVAGFVTAHLEEGKVVEVRSIGAGALNQAFKAVAKSRGFMALKGRDIVVRPGFGDAIIDGEEKTLLKMYVSVN